MVQCGSSIMTKELQVIGSASAWQTQGRGFEPVLMRYISCGKYHGA